MKKFLLPLLVAAVAAALLPAASATTQPSIVITVRMTVTDNTIKLSHKRARRGWGVHFVLINTGRKPHRVDIGGLLTPIVKPGKQGRVSASLENRGRYPYRVTVNGTPQQRGFFIVY